MFEEIKNAIINGLKTRFPEWTYKLSSDDDSALFVFDNTLVIYLTDGGDEVYIDVSAGIFGTIGYREIIDPYSPESTLRNADDVEKIFSAINSANW